MYVESHLIPNFWICMVRQTVNFIYYFFLGISDVYQHTTQEIQRPSKCNPENMPQAQVFDSHRNYTLQQDHLPLDQRYEFS